jgi:HAD superfamily hydrolase (TIGR01549 family)
MIRAVVFDLWNTLVHSQGGNPFQQIKALLRSEQLPRFPEFMRAGMTRAYADANAFLGAWQSELNLDPQQLRAMRQSFQTAGQDAERFPEALDALRGTKEIARLALLSNTQNFDLNLLDHLELAPFFRVQGLSAELGALKPELETFRAMEKRLGLFPGNLAMVGDSWSDDIEGSLAAGWTAIWVNRHQKNRPEHDPEAEVVEVEDLSQVPQVIANLQAGMRCSTCLG